MRSILSFLIFALMAIQMLNAKTYDFTAHIISLASNEAVQGIIVVGITNKGNVEIKGMTDENGTVLFKGLKAKSIHFTATDPSGLYRAHKFTIFKEKSSSVTMKISLRFTE